MNAKLKKSKDTWIDPDDARELDDAFFAKATPYVQGKKATPEEFTQALVKRGRPVAEVTKTPVKLRLDPEILQAMRASGRGWQTRVNALLKEAVRQGQFAPIANTGVGK